MKDIYYLTIPSGLNYWNPTVTVKFKLLELKTVTVKFDEKSHWTNYCELLLRK